MIYEFQLAQSKFQVLADDLRAKMAKSYPTEYQTNYRLSCAVDDLSGSGLAALSAYNNLIPWWLDQQYESNKTWAGRDLIDPGPEIIHKFFFEGDSLTPDEKLTVELYQQASNQALKAMIEKSETQKKIGYAEQSRLAHQRLSASFKSFLFFCRALQDALYCVGLTVKGAKAGAKSSMTNAFKGQSLNNLSPLHSILVNVAGYDAWFLNMREKRNRAKQGTGGSFVGPFPNIGIGISTISREGALTTDVSSKGTFCMADIVVAFQMSANLIAQITANMDLLAKKGE
jgi:hypothetical protein